MEKTIKIDGKNVGFKITGGTLCIYKQQFRKEYYDDVYELELIRKRVDISEKKKYLLNYMIGFRLVWAAAKTADPSIPDPDTWKNGFKKFPLSEILPEITALFSVPENDDTSSSTGERFTSESLTACAVACGLSLNDIYNMPIDFLLNTFKETVSIRSGKKHKDTVRMATQADFMKF